MPPRDSRNHRPIPVVAHKHGEKRVNIPTEELRNFVADAEKSQDRQPLAVAVVPIYIQEQVHPQAIVESVRAEKLKRALRADGDEVLKTFAV